MRLLIFFVLLKLFSEFSSTISSDTSDTYKWPTVGISVLVRNKAHTLPYFLSSLVQLDYPKDRLYIWIYSDFNQDNSIEILENWSERYKKQYNDIYLTALKNSEPYHSDENNVTHWSPKHFKHVIQLREEALTFARKKWADYFFMLDADVFLTNTQTLKQLVRKNVTVVSPMLISDGLYSNFWLEPKSFVHDACPTVST